MVSIHRLLKRPFLLATILLTISSLGIPFATTFAQSHAPGIKTDRAVYAEPPLPIVPSAGQKFIDPVFGAEIMRATDESDCHAPGCGTWYSQWPTFNSDNTRILLRNGVTGDMIIKSFDPVTFTLGATLRRSPTLSGGVSMDWQGATWSRTDPDLIYVHVGYYNRDYPSTGMKLYTYRPSTNVFALLKDFGPELAPGQPDFLFEMHIAQDGKDDIFTLMHNRVGSSDSNPLYFIVWKRSTNTVLHHITNDSTFDGNAALPDKSGRWIYFPLNKTQTDLTRHRVLDVQSNTWQIVSWIGSDDVTSHGDVGTGTMVGHGAFTGGFNVRSLTNVHNQTMLFDNKDANGARDWSNDQHTSLYADNESWALLGLYDDPAETGTETRTFENEMMQISTDGSQRIRRLLHHRSKIDNQTDTTGYWATPKPTISKDGRFIAFTSNWGNSGRYDLFIAKIDPAPPLSAGTATPTPTPTPAPTSTPTPTATPSPTPTPAPPLSLGLVTSASALASGLAASSLTQADQITPLVTIISSAHASFLSEQGRFTSVNEIDRELRASLYFARGAEALARINTPHGSIQNRLQVVEYYLSRAKHAMSNGTSSYSSLLLNLAASGTPVIGPANAVSSASFALILAPASLGTILGDPNQSPLSTKTVFAKVSSAGELPYELNGVSVAIGGLAARLISVSPSRISFYVPAGITLGNTELIVTSQEGYVSRGLTVIASTSPGIFTTNGIGVGDALVLNTATMRPGEFNVTTPENFGADKRTRLIFFSSGLSNPLLNLTTSNDVLLGANIIPNISESLVVEARTTDHRLFLLPVEFAGPSGRGYGLDQVNVRLIPELRNAGKVELTLIAAGYRSNVATITIL